MTTGGPGYSISRRIGELAAARPDEIAYRTVAPSGEETAVSRAEIDRRSGELAAAFASRGLGYGDRLSIALKNSPQFLFATLAAWKLGAVPVPMRWDLPEWELSRLRHAIDGKLHIAVEDLDWMDATVGDEVPVLPDVVSPQMYGICSGGSTGFPKVIMNNRPGTVGSGVSTPFAELWGRRIARPQRICVLGPMYHANAFGTLYQFLEGDHLVVMEQFDAARIAEAVERHRITGFHCTPTMLKRIADLPGIDDRDLSSLEWILQGAAPMPPSLVRRWCELIGPENLLMAYGMSENLGIVALNGVEWANHEGSVGKPRRGTEVRILDGDQREVPTGEIGEIYLRSPAYGGSTYLGDASPLPSTPDGFRSAGDLGHLDGDGYVYLVDRRVDMIVTGGANVYPAEVESALIDHPKVADVVVIGLKDPEWGRRVHALVAPKDPADPPTLAEIRDYAKGRVAAYKAPHSIEVLDRIPRSEATKINRGALVQERGG
ncbi:MAG: AMP-binding protein [Acidimicrobiaceae bacterium]|nr:AMP-binding protein [Acidimicrobiaceae bacterium]